MKLSWSHKLFLKINEHVGHRPILDSFMLFCAKWLIYVLSLSVLFWLTAKFREGVGVYIFKIIIIILVSYLASLVIGFVVRRPRPEIELPQIKQLIHTVGIWKSFPSDHTNFSFLLVFLTMVFGATIYFWLILFSFACLIGIARVYVGVHYPRDILGGIALSILTAIFFYIFIV